MEIIKRDGYRIVLNHTENAVNTGIKGKSLISDTDFDGTLEGYGVEFVEQGGHI